MKSKHVAGLALVAIGTLLAFMGAVSANESMINAGIGGIFLGIVVLSFSTSDHIKVESFKRTVIPYSEFAANIVRSLDLKGKSVYIPPYQNMPNGGVFIPVYDDFDLDLGRLDEETVFLTDTGRVKEMGLVFKPLGAELVKEFEEYSGIDLSDSGLSAVEATSSVLRSIGLAKSVQVYSDGDSLRIYIDGIRFEEMCINRCEQIACPICSSVLSSLAKAFQELILVESFQKTEKGVMILARKIGGVGRWM